MCETCFKDERLYQCPLCRTMIPGREPDVSSATSSMDPDRLIFLQRLLMVSEVFSFHYAFRSRIILIGKSKLAIFMSLQILALLRSEQGRPKDSCRAHSGGRCRTFRWRAVFDPMQFPICPSSKRFGQNWRRPHRSRKSRVTGGISIRFQWFIPTFCAAADRLLPLYCALVCAPRCRGRVGKVLCIFKMFRS